MVKQRKRKRRKRNKLLKAEQEQEQQQKKLNHAKSEQKHRAKKLSGPNGEEFRRGRSEQARQCRQRKKELQQQKQPQPQPEPIVTNRLQNSTGKMSDTIIGAMLDEHGELNRLEDEEHQRRVEQMRRNNDSQRQLMETNQESQRQLMEMNQRDHEEYMDKNEAYVHQEFQSAQKKREDRFQSIVNTAERMHGQRPSLLDGDQFYFDTNDGSNTNISSDLFGAKNEVPDTVISTPTKAAPIRKNKASTAKKVQPKKAGATKAKATAPTKRPGTGKKREGTFYS